MNVITKELIVRLTDVNSDVEILENNIIDEEIKEKKISLIDFSNIVSKLVDRNQKKTRKKIKLIKNAIYQDQELIIIKQPEILRYVTYSVSNTNKAYKINFPASLYFIYRNSSEILKIEAFMYLKWEDENTQLYKYAMPNMLGGNAICIGNAKREIGKDINITLEEIIYAPYSHQTLNNVKGFKNTEDYFQYLENNKIAIKHLYKAAALKKVLNVDYDE